MIRQPKSLLSLLSRCSHVRCLSASTRTSSDRLFAWGKEQLHDQDQPQPNIPHELDLRKLLIRNNVAISDDEAVEITHLAAGWGHTLVGLRRKLSTTEGNRYKEHILSFGINKSGQLGLGFTSTDFCRGVIPNFPPQNRKSNDPVLLGLACGREHSFALTAEIATGNAVGTTAVFGFGNTMHGQLGNGRCKRELTNTTVASFSTPHPTSLGPVVEVNPIRTTALDDVVQVKTGLDHSVFLRRNGTVLTMGWGPDGQLGQGEPKSDDGILPKQVENLNDVKIDRIFTGSADYTVALSDATKTMYTWGNSEYAQCMHGHKADRVCSPTRVPFGNGMGGLGRVMDVAVGGTFAVLLDDAGDIYTIGFGALGVGKDVIESMEPRRLEEFREKIGRPKKIFAGLEWAGALLDNNEIYTWGHCPSRNLFLNQPEKLDFGGRENFDILDVVCGSHHGLIRVRG